LPRARFHHLQLRPALGAAAAAWLVAIAIHAGPAAAAPKRALFDNTHAETASNADWVIDTDQPLPLPDQATVTAATPRTYWLGAISSWGIDLVKRGYQVATLTSAYGITHGNAGNLYDLSNFDVFIVPEPNTVFSAPESTAIFNFVREGGGLVAVADHIVSDRNGDGWDSPQIWNKLDAQHRWGASFDVTGANSNFSEVWSTNVSADLSDSTIYGPVGTVNGLEFHNGTTLTLYPVLNPTVRGSVWRNGSPHGNSAVMAAHSVYGNGRVFFVGDSSPVDDGSAAPGNSSIFDGWAEAAGGDSLLMMNATLWATRRDAPALAVEPSPSRLLAPFPNPFRASVRMRLELARAEVVSVGVFDVSGRQVRGLAQGTVEAGAHDVTWDGLTSEGQSAPAGLYLVQARAGAVARSWRLMRLR
jgi:hypothetical protein